MSKKADVSKKETAPIQGILKKLLKKLGRKDRLTEEDLLGAWEEVVGAQAAAHSRPVSLRRSRLAVNVDDSGWLYELTLKKKDVITELEGRLKGRRLKDIRFRIGEVRRSGNG